MALSDRFGLSRDMEDNSRVNLQHYLWVKQFGYLLHPDIPTDDKHLRVADIGTHTGIWLTHLAETLPPSARLDGFDITLDATPPAKWLAPNITFQHWDVRTEPAREWIGIYDVVHLRIFSLYINESQAVGVLARLKKLLKPGGYLEWGETDMASWRIEKSNPANKVDSLTELFRRARSELPTSWCAKLPGMFLQEGFENVKSDVRDTPPHLLMPLHDSSILFLSTWINRLISNTEEKAKLRLLIQQADREALHGSVWVFTRPIVIGRKPLGGLGADGSASIPDGGATHPHGHLFFPF
ncbi:S-adenosyl-L-methionine-dependent methyltransferase [Aspergillus steynii IBT 23096]|uniref:S-adenosyl-L-methionine-dependent methyltransferase n=1 Tax=Aspergillus steynii IBT 23096 TaxID=1392250 RepID=A0A2I2GLZ7_9EURO|nr:S-adenosyl-L-methionine-dependent methyltransferase [Aspergillus steynii IBT 23096]PLB53896.1 S-adenosyl-L-methionine-dependent methyltransferase [Aspergillus steynii IBT 23096]